MTGLQVFLYNDFPVLAAGVLASIACALVGCFLVLRRMSLMGDAISHAIVPGIVGAFLLTHSVETLPMLTGAVIVGVLTATLSELIHRIGRVEPGAAMGVVFTVLFAIGVIMLERSQGARTVHIDADCVLYGAMQLVTWTSAPPALSGLLTAEAWTDFPRQVTTLAAVCVLNTVFVVALFKELRISSFDPALAAAQGVSPGLMHYLLMAVTAITTVAAFEAVGSIMVVAMLIVPALAAHLLTDRLALMLVLAAAVAAVTTAGGYAASAALSVDAAGMIGVSLGVLMVLVGLLAPRQGWLGRLGRWVALSVSIRREDMLGLLYRFEEIAPAGSPPLTPAHLREAAGGGPIAWLAYRRLRRRREAMIERGAVVLTEGGRRDAARLIRSHRLWEAYLVRHLGLRPDHVHGTAMVLEHLTDDRMRRVLAEDTDRPHRDPHGREIPGAE